MPAYLPDRPSFLRPVLRVLLDCQASLASVFPSGFIFPHNLVVF